MSEQGPTNITSLPTIDYDRVLLITIIFLAKPILYKNFIDFNKNLIFHTKVILISVKIWYSERVNELIISERKPTNITFLLITNYDYISRKTYFI
jgi:predicted small integral membrane protein